jgi:hypothetical protein
MSPSRPPFSDEVRALLDRERAVPPLPASIRARAIARARAALVAGRVTAPASFGALPRHRWGVTIALACAASAAVGATAYELGAHRHAAANDSRAASVAHTVAPVPAPSTPAPAVVAEPSSTPAPAIAAQPSSTPSAPSRALRSSQPDPGPDELRLLRQARAAVARQDFAAALPPIAEHARRFKDGRLAEEREALRVRALSGLGRTEAARHAADAFEARFPRSVLLPAVSHMPASGP